ncbi:MAG: hypothetical protein U0350_25210 [Caldilineaceae bacterium]
MKKSQTMIVAGLLILLTAFFGLQGQAARAKDTPKLLAFETMIGVPKPYTGPTNTIRNLAGGGLPWVISDAQGELKANGELHVKVKGLVLDPNDPGVIAAGRAGQNPIANFGAIVSCLSKDGSGNPTIVNVPTTDLFPATTGLGGGDAEIEAQLSLPKPCIAPIVFVTSPGGAWFAATGN